MNTHEELQRLRRQRPFVTFLIVLKDGRQFQINRPLQYAFTEDQVVVIDDERGVEPFKLTDIAELKELHAVS
jgi:hypothetical protein